MYKMEKTVIEGIEIKTSWEQITLEEFLPLSVIEKNEELLDKPLRKSLERIKVLTGKDEEELLDLPGDVFGHLITASKFLDVEPETLFKESATFFIGEVEYGYRKPGELSAGEYISLELGIAKAIKQKSSMLPDILSILIRPVVRGNDPEIGETVDVEKFDAKKHQPRIDKFMKELRVPFFIHALSRITVGAQGVNQVVKNFMSTDDTTKKGKKSKKK